MSYRPNYHRKYHAIRFGYIELRPGLGVAWDGGGIRPLDDSCGFGWLTDCLIASKRFSKELLVRGKDHWSWAVNGGKPEYQWKRRLIFRGPPVNWEPVELAHYYLLAERGLVDGQICKRGIKDE